MFLFGTNNESMFLVCSSGSLRKMPKRGSKSKSAMRKRSEKEIRKFPKSEQDEVIT